MLNDGTAKPYVRWWWLSGPFTESDITEQLQWIKANGFGGVELAWIDPSWLDEPERSAPRPTFLGEDWSRLVAFTKQASAILELGCDFTFGSAWPFGGSWLTTKDAAKTFDGLSEQRLGGSWERTPRERMYVLDHLSGCALDRYAAPLLRALSPALAGAPSALFCDSLEISTERLWSPLLWEEFAERFSYRLEPHADTLDEEPDFRYDYRKLLSEVIVREFYQPFTKMCRDNGYHSRVQCHGAPADLLAAYASVDIPESEALLFLPPFSRIAASAAAWAGKRVVSAEAFTCLHGFPGWDDSAEELWKEERAGDLKLVADALFANGVNQLVWHGMPYRPRNGEQEFYASVHIGPDSPFAASLPALNDYFAQVCRAMRRGRTYSSIGVYLPNEDALLLDRISQGERTPGANYEWEMRSARQPSELQGFAPVWISSACLKAASCEEKTIRSQSLILNALYVDCEWLDFDAVLELARLSAAGARIVWKRRPRQPGHNKAMSYERLVDKLLDSRSTLRNVIPLITGEDLPTYWAREVEDELILFFAHPCTSQITYPMMYRLSETATEQDRLVAVTWNGHQTEINLRFQPNDPVLLRVSAGGSAKQVQLPRAKDIGA